VDIEPADETPTMFWSQLEEDEIAWAECRDGSDDNRLSMKRFGFYPMRKSDRGKEVLFRIFRTLKGSVFAPNKSRAIRNQA
jgi:hypothetical protein